MFTIPYLVSVRRVSGYRALAFIAGLAFACGGESLETSTSASKPGSGSEKGAPVANEEQAFVDEGDSNADDPPPAVGAELTLENACEAVSSEAEELTRPMDVIVIIDNSTSMTEEIAAVERNINVNFAAILDASGIDYRVLMVSGYRANGQPAQAAAPGGRRNGAAAGGTRDNRVCVGPPLGPSECAGRTPADSPHNPDRFFHFDQPIGSGDGPCLLFQTLQSPPVTSSSRGIDRAPTRADDPTSQEGWTEYLRFDSFKAFIMIGDDTVDCQIPGLNYQRSRPETSAQAFDNLLLSTAPDLFGETSTTRKYAWHSIVGVAPKATGGVYEPGDAIVTRNCDSAEQTGAPHQSLSRLTGGLRYPVCAVESYDAVFQRIAGEIVEGAALPCSWKIPPPPGGSVYDRSRVNLEYFPGDGSKQPELGQVDGAADCKKSMAWYYDDPAAPTTVHACPAACEKLSEDTTGRVDLLFACGAQTPKLK